MRCSNFSKIAAHLADQHKHSNLYISILIEDLKDYSKALDYIEKLPPIEIGNYLELYSTVLMENCEEEMIKVLSKIAFLKGFFLIFIK